MEHSLIRLLKPVLVALVAFGAVYWLTKDSMIAMTFALLPLLLGWLGIMESVAYGLTALALIVAVGSAVLPPSTKQDIVLFYNETVTKLSDRASEGSTVRDAADGQPRSGSVTR